MEAGFSAGRAAWFDIPCLLIAAFGTPFKGFAGEKSGQQIVPAPNFARE
jgi:hypothetical protein